MEKIKIMFVCLGNICRSPMAEFIFKHLIKEQGIGGDFIVNSSAISDEEYGNPVYPPAKEQLKKHGIPVCERHAVQLEQSDYAKYDLFLCMDSSNVRLAKRLFFGDPENKVKLLLSYTGEERDVFDPYYTRRFDIAYDDIYKGCVALLNQIKK